MRLPPPSTYEVIWAYTYISHCDWIYNYISGLKDNCLEEFKSDRNFCYNKLI
jgi:hypothetical protein